MALGWNGSRTAWLTPEMEIPSFMADRPFELLDAWDLNEPSRLLGTQQD